MEHPESRHPTTDPYYREYTPLIRNMAAFNHSIPP